MGFGKKNIREKIMQLDDMEYRDVLVPSWDDEVITLRSLTAAESGKLQERILIQEGKKTKINFEDAQSIAVTMAVVDKETHEQVFQFADYKWIKKKNGKAIKALWDEIAEMNGLTEEDQEELKNASEVIQRIDSQES